MRLKVRLFASLKARLGPTIDVEVGDGASAGEVITALKGCDAWVPGARLAINHEFAHASVTIGPADEVALIPPVSGG